MKNIYLILVSLFVFTFSDAQNRIKPDLYQNNKEDYSFLIEDSSNSKFEIGDIWAYGMLSGIYGSFPLEGPYNINQTNTIPYIITASDFDGSGTIYGVDFLSYELISIDPYTGNSNVVAVLSGYESGHTIDGMSWNYINSTMYVVSGNGSTSTLYTLDINTGILTVIGNTGTVRGVWIVIDNYGKCYMADASTDELFSVNLVNGEPELIGSLGINIEYSQEADIDTATNELYLPGYLGGSIANVYLVDVITGNASLLGPLENGYELGVFAIEGPPVIVDNFSCENAIPIVLGITSSIDPANTEGGASNVCFTGAINAEWYSYTALNSGELTITSDLSSNNGIDTRLSVYNNDCINLACIISDDNSGTNNTSIASFPVLVGTTYLIEWDDAFNMNTFDFELLFAIDCPYPENFSINDITETTANLNWNTVVNASSGYILSIFHQGDDPLTDSSVFSETYAEGVNTGTATGLLADTSYDAYIVANCNSNISEMNMINFSTATLSIINNSKNKIIIYPSLTQDILNIDSQQSIERVKIYSLQGQLIIEDSSNSVDVSQLSAGLYFAQIFIDGQTVTKKFIKE